MTTERLTSLTAVKEWLGISSDGSDDSLTQLIDSASRFVLNYLAVDSFRRTTYTMNFRGNGKTQMQLPNWPILSVASVGIGGTSIPASPGATNGLPQSGYVVSDRRKGPQSLELYGYFFGYRLPSQVVYTAGFETTDEVTIGSDPDPYTFTPTNQGTWSEDLGVTIDGVEATKVTSAPAAGEYSVDEWGKYSFNVADDTLRAVISYSFTPADVAFAVTELIGFWWKSRDRIGILSKNLGGQESITFLQSDMSEISRASLQPYKRVI